MPQIDPLLSLTFKTLRKATGLSQVKFAALIGWSPSTVESIETIRLGMSSELANSIAAFTGVNPASLLKPTGVPVALNGEDYTSDIWEMWQAMESTQEEFVSILQRASLSIQLMLIAARENSSGTKQTPAKFRAFVFRFSQWMEAMREEFGIEETTQTLLRNATTKSKSTEGTIAQMRQAFADSPTLKARENPAWKDQDPVTVTETLYQLWNPLCGIINLQRGDEKGHGFATSADMWRKEVVAKVGNDQFLIDAGEEGRVFGIVGASAFATPAPTPPAKSKPSRSQKRKA